jgi:hypothetical protein
LLFLSLLLLLGHHLYLLIGCRSLLPVLLRLFVEVTWSARAGSYRGEEQSWSSPIFAVNSLTGCD